VQALREYLQPAHCVTSSWAGSMRHIIAILLQNESGALARVAAMFANRGFNIESLSVAPTDDETVSRLTLVTSGPDDIIAQISKQLAKLIDVVAMVDMTAGDHIERELGLLKMQVSAEGLAELRQRTDNFGARILDDRPEHFTLELTGSKQQLDSFVENLPEGVHLLAVVRSGPLAMSRGAQQLVAPHPED
jgi:acetolactate synthase I/III small subunit